MEIKKELKRKQCVHCNKTFKNDNTLETHERYFHVSDGVQTNKCLLCSAVFNTVRLLNGHFKRVHATFPCSQCEKTYRSRESLRLHEFNHAGEAKFICDVCSKAFLNPRRLRDHLRIHGVVDLDLICEFCGYRTNIGVNLVVHKRQHTLERPYCCEECGKCFASHHQLKEHKSVHTKERMHECNYCGVTFLQAKTLYHHMHLHLETKKYMCTLCHKSFAQAAGFSSHMRCHRDNNRNCMAEKINKT